MKILVSWSTGKDSAWLLHTLHQQYLGAVSGLLTTVNEAFDRVAMHAVRRELLQEQADAAGYPLYAVDIPWPCSNAEYERRMSAAVSGFVREGFTHVAFGDLFLEDVRRYREERLAGTGLTPLFPLWKTKATSELAREMIAGGLRAWLTCVDPRKLDSTFAGRAFDLALLGDLPSGVDPCGENGEFHTFAWDGPMFSRPISVTVGDVVQRDGFVFADLNYADSKRLRRFRNSREPPYGVASVRMESKHDSFVLKTARSEVQQKGPLQVGRPKIVDHLSVLQRTYRGQCLDLHEHRTIADEINTIGHRHNAMLVNDRELDLAHERDVSGRQLDAERFTVDAFKEPAAQLTMDFHGGADDRVSLRIPAVVGIVLDHVRSESTLRSVCPAAVWRALAQRCRRNGRKNSTVPT